MSLGTSRCLGISSFSGFCRWRRAVFGHRAPCHSSACLCKDMNSKETSQPAWRRWRFFPSEFLRNQVRILSEGIRGYQFGRQKVTYDKILYTFTTNNMHDQNHQDAESIDSFIFPRTSSSHCDRNLDLSEIYSEILRPRPHKEAPNQETKPIHGDHC